MIDSIQEVPFITWHRPYLALYEVRLPEHDNDSQKIIFLSKYWVGKYKR